MAVNLPNSILKQTDVRETITNTEESSVRFDLDFAIFDTILDLSAGSITGLFISPDGLQLYICNTDDDVVQFTMTSPFDLSTATITHTLDVSAKETDLVGLFFKPDGTKMYTVGGSGKSIDEYDLSTAFLLSSALYQQEFDLSGIVSGGAFVRDGLFFREDGKQAYFGGADGQNKVWSLHLSTAWDITSAVELDEIQTLPTIGGLTLSRDGSKLFFVKTDTNDVRVWPMTTVYRLSTAAADSIFSPFPATTGIYAIAFNQTGSKMYISDGTSLLQYSIKRGWR